MIHPRRDRIWAWLVITAIWAAFALPLAAATADTEKIAQQIADSLVALRGKGSRYKTIAFSQIKSSGPSDIDLIELVDYTTTKILQTVLELDVVNRSQLQRILREQKFQLSEIVSADQYKELGKLAGVDLFIYGNLYGNILVLKAIDVQNSVIAWAELIAFDDRAKADLAPIDKIGADIVSSMRDNPRLKRAKVRKISFWNIKTSTRLSEEELIDYLTV